MNSDLVDDDPPRAFVDWSVLGNLLSQTTTGGVKAAILMKIDGALLSVSMRPGSDSTEDSSTERIVGALVSNIWKSLEFQAKAALDVENLSTLFLDCEEGTIAVNRISRFLFVLYCEKSCPLGEIKRKIDSLQLQLQPLNRVY